MPAEDNRNGRVVDRRRILKAAAGIAAAAIGFSVRDTLAKDYCYWQTQQSRCLNGRRREYRCEVCCAGGVCETVQCLWFDVGPC